VGVGATLNPTVAYSTVAHPHVPEGFSAGGAGPAWPYRY
jgi:hypothetical protein